MGAGRAARCKQADQPLTAREIGSPGKRTGKRDGDQHTEQCGQPGLHQREPGDAQQVGALVARRAAAGPARDSDRNQHGNRYGQARPTAAKAITPPIRAA
jgi:hypothetical protein